MNKEIKEILEALKPQDEEFVKAGIKEFPLQLTLKEQKILLDYIIDLQKQLSQFTSTINELAKSNVGLQEKINRLLDNRDKAIEYIRQEDWNTEYDKKLLNILTGGDEE